MLKKVAVAASTLMAGLAAFIGTSYAQDSEPELPTWLPAASSPAVSLSAERQVAINNLIADDAAAQFGISAESFSRVRLLAQSEKGPVYVIPGTRGACLALETAAACSDLRNRGGVLLALLVPNENGQLVGAGLVDSGASTVEVSRAGESPAKTRAVLGRFVLSAADGVAARRGHPLTFNAG
jgi:hypothetical protein